VIALSLLVTAAGLFSVQFRDTMPPRVFETRLGMAMQHYRDGSYDQAAAIVEEMRERGHKNHPHLIALAGRIEYHRGNLREAETLFSDLVERRADDPVPAYNLALIRFEQGYHKESARRFDTIATEFSASHPSLAQRAVAAAALSREVAGEPAAQGE
jgi:predicted Zn-dependent protease